MRYLPWVAAAGAALLAAGTFLHPMQADPNDPAAAFAEYAADPLWVASHLTQLAGVAAIVAALVLVSSALARGPARPWALLGAAGAAASLATAAALQAVDGVALKAMVDRWAAAADAEKAMAFQAAVGVRHIEIGLAAMMGLVFGGAVAAYGLAVFAEPRLDAWLGWLALASGAGLVASGTATAFTGFSAAAMNVNMPSTVAALVWVVAIAARVRRLLEGERRSV